MRRNFAQILKESQIDIKAEYQKLYGMLYDRSIQVSNTKRISAYDEISDYFVSFYFRGTCLSINEFNDIHGFHFEKEPENFNIDHLVTLCEYMYNMLMAYQGAVGYQYGIPQPLPMNVQFGTSQILQVINAIGYMQTTLDSFTVFVEKSPEAIAVAESNLIPANLSYKLISYNHHSMKGQLDEKKNTLLQLAAILEGKRKILKAADKNLEKELFYLFNNLDLRHNNTDPENDSKYNNIVAQMPTDELEKWYDETYQMCLLAILQMEHAERKKSLKNLHSLIDKPTQ